MTIDLEGFKINYNIINKKAMNRKSKSNSITREKSPLAGRLFKLEGLKTT
ncbi:hypothetical protein BN175_190080 [Clostridioides difficile T23]|uniref:Uncharacterized protein n=1 Tax=Clostridioides difficile TaxID=1496 RepID=A0A069B1D6_CLODI|nr:hypothetical protein QAQ_1608 [Clostridioides difficile CD8]EQI00903.1 hypothetical protein QO7_1595 [Clostridioides difficile F314]EQI98023.1 hypothetical protein QQQ_1596 [Clostridioides difficile P5]CCL10974.1 hypothetical protein BN169_680054 [Clostridioides difficile E16]CCL13735.1 hypothetical protein BN170_1430039 [Clostridioides difficile T22]CCL17780.1 hypothetical protein BN171_1800003 [Clostridioides difficile E25]CCL21720.1 hypothetical protein BN172_2340008 [Clostridioides dif